MDIGIHTCEQINGGTKRDANADANANANASASASANANANANADANANANANASGFVFGGLFVQVSEAVAKTTEALLRPDAQDVRSIS